MNRSRRLFFSFLVVLFASGLRAQLQPTVVQRHFKPGGATLRAVAATATRIVAVGDNGSILTSTKGGDWAPTDSGVTEHLRGVAAITDSTGLRFFVAVGDNGRILHSPDGLAWSLVTVPGLTARLSHISFKVSFGDIWITGEDGTVLASTDGRNWSALPSGATGRVNASSAYDGLIVGDGGMIRSREISTSWRPLASGTSRNLLGIAHGSFSTPPPTLVYLATFAVGEGGEILLGQHGANGFTFARSSSPTSATLRGIAGGNQSTVAVGDAGTVLFFDGNSGPHGPWVRLESGTATNLTGVAVRSSIEGQAYFITGENELILLADLRNKEWLRNLSTRAYDGTGDATLISGFVIRGTQPKPLLVRAAGPALDAYNVPNAIRRPMLTIYDHAGKVVAQNASWSSNPNASEVRATAQAVGAFPFAENSEDSALLVQLPPGGYTAHVTDRNGSVGLALVELYDPDNSMTAPSRVVNLSTRCFVGTGAAITIPGLQSSGNRQPRLLIRAVGPGLERHGVTGFLRDPKIEIIRPESLSGGIGGGVLLPAFTAASNDNWNEPRSNTSPVNFAQATPEEMRAIATTAGAFPLDPGSKDAAILLTLDPGLYSIQISGVNGESGIALIEVYDVTDL